MVRDKGSGVHMGADGADRVPVGGTRRREAAAVVALGPASLLGSRDQLEQAWRRRETELAVLETGFNKYFGT